MRNAFGRGERSPSMGQWPPEAYEEERQLSLKERKIHRPGKFEKLTTGEDKLVDLIDNGPQIEDDDIGHDRFEVMDEVSSPANIEDDLIAERAFAQRAQEEDARAEKYFVKLEAGNQHQNSRLQVTPKERQDIAENKIRKYSKVPKRNSSNAQIGTDVMIRQARKASLDNRISA